MKKDVEDIEPMLDRVLQIKVRRYRWKEDDESVPLRMGVISQEIQPLFPDLVTETPCNIAGTPDEEPKYEDRLMVAYTDFGLVAIKALQELNERQEAEISPLSRMVEQHGEALAELRRMIEQSVRN